MLNGGAAAGDEELDLPLRHFLTTILTEQNQMSVAFRLKALDIFFNTCNRTCNWMRVDWSTWSCNENPVRCCLDRDG